MLAPLLSRSVKVSPSWTPEYVSKIANRKIEVSRKFKIAVSKLYLHAIKRKNKLRIRNDALRVYVPVDSEEQRELINKTFPGRAKLDALLFALHFEDVE